MRRASILFTTIDKENEFAFCEHLIKNKFASCIERFEIKSMHWWEDQMWNSEEISLIIKTLPRKLKVCIKEMEKKHPYDCPQIISLKANIQNKSYFDFIKYTLK